MKKQIINLFFLILVSIASFGQTNVSGLISSDTKWTKTGSPYIVTGNMAVDQGITLTIDPGVRVKFNGLYYIYIDGSLKATGLITDSIYFTSNNLTPSIGNWVGIKFRSTSINSLIDYCHIDFAQTAISIDGASPIISHSLIKKNSTGINISWNTGYPKILNNIITYNSTSGIMGGSYVGTDVIGNEISHNDSGISTGAWSFKVNNNNICYNNQGINFSLGGGGSINEMSGNTIHHNTNYGLYLFGYPLSIYTPLRYNQITYNGVGIYCKDFQGTISNNDIAQNGTGILNAQGSYASSLSVIQNSIYNNSINFKQLRSTNISATNNWWGTTDSPTIASLIYDYYDDFNLGKVLYSPILTTSATTSLLTGNYEIKLADNNSNISVFPNPTKGVFRIKNCLDLKSISVYNLQGDVIFSTASYKVNPFIEIDLSDYSSGIYFVKICDENNTYMKKILKQ